jgi:hypothetical protein
VASRKIIGNALVNDLLAYLAVVWLLARKCWRGENKKKRTTAATGNLVVMASPVLFRLFLRVRVRLSKSL